MKLSIYQKTALLILLDLIFAANMWYAIYYSPHGWLKNLSIFALFFCTICGGVTYRLSELNRKMGDALYDMQISKGRIKKW